MITVTAFWYNNAPYGVIATFGLTLAKAACVASLFSGRRWISWLGPFLAIASCAGLVAGLRVYSSQLALYYRYKESARNVNVAAAEDAGQFVGTGMITFKAGTRVDADRSVGYMSARAGARLCVAPIIDGSMRQTDPVTFWAVGMDCCSWRGLFTCGDADDVEAHSAFLSLSAPTVLAPWMAWIWGDDVISEGYQAALRLHHAVYDMVIANSTRTLRWTKDPLAIQDAYFSGAIWGVIAWIALFAFGSVIMGICASIGFYAVWAKVERSHGQFRESAMGWQFDYSANKQRGNAARTRYHLQYL